MGTVTLQTIFQDAFPTYEQTHPLPAHVRRAARAIMQCRTAALGGHIQACPDGHVARIWYNACRHRSCPQCAYLQPERWLALQRARLLACDHYHVIFTLPHALNPLWLANVAVMTTLLFQAVRDTLVELLADPKSRGAQPGLLAALHTWSQTLVLHPHVHCLVTGGGLTAAGAWKAVRNGFLLPVRVVMAVFRGKLLAAIRHALARAELVLPEAIRPQQMLNLLTRLGQPRKTKWNVHIRERYAHGVGVVTYLARYLRGGPLKHARLVAYDGEQVTFLHRARQEEADGGRASPQRMPLPVTAFLQRWLRHVPAPQRRVVRAYGLSHPSKAEALAVCRTALGQPPVEAPVALAWQTVCAERGALHPERCPLCGQLLVCTGVLPRGGAPPPLAGEEAAGALDCKGEACQGRGVPAGGPGQRARACGGAQGRSGGQTAPACAWGRSLSHRCPARGQRGARCKLHSVRRGRPGQAVAVRGPSNQGMKRTSGHVRGAQLGRRAASGRKRGVSAGARRRLSLNVRRPAGTKPKTQDKETCVHDSAPDDIRQGSSATPSTRDSCDTHDD